MRRTASFVFACVVWLAALHAAVVAQSAPQAQQGQQQAPTFRSSVTLVPVDVRVLDRNGKPVTDLEQKDFTVLEDGKPQPIGQFSRLELATGPATPGVTPPRRLSSFSLAEQKNRIFLIVLGRGRLQEPSKGVDALMQFVREHLLPQDQVAVFAYDRATDFTTDHEEIARLLERFRRLHEGIDMEIGLQINSGLAAVYGARAIPKNLQSRIDQIFMPGGPLASHDTPSGQAAGSQVNQTVKEVTSAVQRLEIEKQNQQLDAMAPAGAPQRVTLYSELEQLEASLFTRLSLNDFMEVTGQSLQDLGNIYAGIEYLRHLDGEKHLLYVSEKGMNLPSQDEDELLAKTANDARVVLDTFQTGGIYEIQTGGEPVASMQQTFANKTMKWLAETTGGVSTVMESGKVAMDRLADATRAGYVIGYYPSSAAWDGRYRTITVKVNRPDTTVLFRHGYFGREEIGAFDRRTFITRNRIQAALTFRRELKEIRVKMDVATGKTDAGPMVAVKATIDPTRLALKLADGLHVGELDIAILVTDDKGQQIMGQSYQRAGIRLTEEAYQKARKDGIPYAIRFPVVAGGRNVRMVVYDFKADLAGSADQKIW